MSSSSSKENQCANCGSPAQVACSGCMDAPSYVAEGNEDVISPTSTYYCDKKCQKAHWEGHKQSCKVLATRIALARAAEFLKQLIMVVKRYNGRIDIKRVDVDGNRIIIHGPKPRHLSETAFPPAMFNDEAFKDHPNEVREAILLDEGCNYPTCKFFSITMKLIQGISHTSATELLFMPKPGWRKYELNLAPPAGGHSVYLICTTTKERWIIDPTIGQFRAAAPLQPYATYRQNMGIFLSESALSDQEARRVYRKSLVYVAIDSVQYSRTIWDSSFKTVLAPLGIHDAMAQLVPVIEQRLNELQNGASWQTILKGSTTAFDEKQKLVLSMVDEEVKKVMARDCEKKNLKKLGRQLGKWIDENLHTTEFHDIDPAMLMVVREKCG